MGVGGGDGKGRVRDGGGGGGEDGKGRVRDKHYQHQMYIQWDPPNPVPL